MPSLEKLYKILEKQESERNSIMETKKARNSTTIQGAIAISIVLILNVLRMFGLNLDLDEGIITELVATAFAFGAVVMVVVGRVKARFQLSGF